MLLELGAFLDCRAVGLPGSVCSPVHSPTARTPVLHPSSGVREQRCGGTLASPHGPSFLSQPPRAHFLHSPEVAVESTVSSAPLQMAGPCRVLFAVPAQVCAAQSVHGTQQHTPPISLPSRLACSLTVCD